MTGSTVPTRHNDEADALVRRVLDAARAFRGGVRRENGRELPLGTKAIRTRDALLASAYKQFATNGYQATSVAEIAKHAGVSLGAFYQYFRDRADILLTLVGLGVTEQLRENNRRWDPARGRIGLRRIIATFVRAYVDSAEFQAVWEEVSHVDKRMAALRRDLSRLFTGAVEDALTEGAECGLVRSDLDPASTARALTAMVDRYCYTTYVFDPPAEGPPSVDDSVDLLTALWADAIGLVEGAGRASSE